MCLHLKKTSLTSAPIPLALRKGPDDRDSIVQDGTDESLNGHLSPGVRSLDSSGTAEEAVNELQTRVFKDEVTFPILVDDRKRGNIHNRHEISEFLTRSFSKSDFKGIGSSTALRNGLSRLKLLRHMGWSGRRRIRIRVLRRHNGSRICHVQVIGRLSIADVVRLSPASF